MNSYEPITIADYLPHAGNMCLLSHVTHRDDTTLGCEAQSHLDLKNPLRSNNQLAAICGVEYAAQAMALHMGLGDVEHSSQKGFLASLKTVKLDCARLDTLNEPLTINVSALFVDPNLGAMYDFRLTAAQKPLVSGQCLILFASTEARAS